VGLMASAIGDADARAAAAWWLALVGDGRTLCASGARPSRESCQSARLAARWFRSGYVRATIDAGTSHQAFEKLDGPGWTRTSDQRIMRIKLFSGNYSNQSLATHAKFQEQLRAA